MLLAAESEAVVQVLVADLQRLAAGTAHDEVKNWSDVAAKLGSATDVAGQPLQSLGQFATEWSASVQYKFITEAEMTASERTVFRLWREIAALGGGLPPQFSGLEISETMRPSMTEGMNPMGLWEPDTGRVVIHRSQLASVEAFAGTLLHELTHARTGADDLSRTFEIALTDVIGRVAARSLRAGKP